MNGQNSVQPALPYCALTMCESMCLAAVLAETDGKSPSLLNGGLEQVEVLPSLYLAAFAAMMLEGRDVRAREAAGLGLNEYPPDRVPGDLSFDPLRISANLPFEQQIDFMERGAPPCAMHMLTNAMPHPIILF